MDLQDPKSASVSAQTKCNDNNDNNEFASERRLHERFKQLCDMKSHIKGYGLPRQDLKVLPRNDTLKCS